MLTNLELIDLCRAYGIMLNGIFLRDQVPRVYREGFYIWNLDDSQLDKEYGTHWTCSISDGDECVYFDSYGAPPPNEVKRFIKTKYRQFGMNAWIIQSLKSTLCGWFCLALAIFAKMHRRKYNSLSHCVNDFINMFDSNDKSDDVLRRFFRSLEYIPKLTRQKLLR